MIELLKTKLKNSLKLSKPKRKTRKLSGQGMVEFALALPILLMVVYGLLETGRLLFIYGSTVSAARQAARYGSVSGMSDNGVPYYRDCAGIESAVRNLGFIHIYDTINITYDRGLDSSGNVVAIPGIDPDPTAYTCNSMNDTTLQNGDRIKVQASTVWTPVLSIVPSWQGFTITSSAERTILSSVAVGVDPEAQQWIPGGALTIAVTSSTISYDEVGDIIYYTYTLTNVATFDLHGPWAVIDSEATTNCSGAPGTLVPSGSFTCSGYHTVTQADLDNGEVTDFAGATSLETSSNQAGVTVYAIQNKSLTLEKTPNQLVAANAGTVITYTYTLSNSGNVTLGAPYSVTDNKIGSAQINCTSAASVLAPGSQTTCSGTYTITAADISNGSVTNIATATATFSDPLNQTEVITSNTDSAIVTTSVLGLNIQTSRASVDFKDQVISYTYTLTNYGTSALNAPYNLTDNRVTGISCPSGTLNPGASLICTGSYIVKQSDIDSGLNITNQATVTSGSITSNQATATVTVNQLPTLTLTVVPSTTLATVAGTTVNYQYVLSNTGNTTLTSPYSVSDTAIPDTITCASTSSLIPGTNTICTATHTVSATDISNGSIISGATGNAYLGTQVITAQGTATVITYNGPRLTLTITSTPDSYSYAGTVLNFTFTLKNTGNVVLSAPYEITASSFLGTVSCPNTPASLTSGAQVVCTASYTTPPSDVTAREIIVGGSGTALNGASLLTSNTASVTVPFTFQCYVYHRLSTSTTSITYPGPGQTQMSMNVISDAATGGTIYISSIQLLNWNLTPTTPASNKQYVSSITFGGVTIFTGTTASSTSPITFGGPFSGDVSLLAGNTKALVFNFNRNYSPLGNEIIKVTFTDSSCPVLDSSNSLQVK